MGVLKYQKALQGEDKRISRLKKEKYIVNGKNMQKDIYGRTWAGRVMW
jgi:hypothetical protein